MQVEYDFTGSILHVTIVKCEDLAAMDIGGTSDPYVKVYLLPDRKRKQVRVCLCAQRDCVTSKLVRGILCRKRRCTAKPLTLYSTRRSSLRSHMETSWARRSSSPSMTMIDFPRYLMRMAASIYVIILHIPYFLPNLTFLTGWHTFQSVSLVAN